MRIIIVVLLALILGISCNSRQKAKQKNNVNFKGKNPAKIVTGLDTSIEYSIEGISLEGTSVNVKYINGKIKESKIVIYGETGQNQIVYIFDEKKIYVSEKQLIYNTTLEKINSENEMRLKKKINYVLDFSGNPIGNVDIERTYIFREFKKVVPFELK